MQSREHVLNSRALHGERGKPWTHGTSKKDNYPGGRLRAQTRTPTQNSRGDLLLCARRKQAVCLWPGAVAVSPLGDVVRLHGVGFRRVGSEAWRERWCVQER